MLDVYRIRCRDCSYGREYGQHELTPHTYAAKHAVTRRHIVDMIYGTTVVHTVSVDQLEFTPSDEPPF